jgi:hypothetical protein
MRGSDERTGELFSYVDLEKRVPARPVAACALWALSADGAARLQPAVLLVRRAWRG